MSQSLNQPPDARGGAQETVRSAVRAIAAHQVAGCHVVEHGQGPRVFVAFHGWSGSHRSYDPMVERLPVDATLFAFDLPGAGASPPPSAWTADALVERTEAALDALDLREITLIAACGGTGPGVRLAGRRPDRIQRLVLVDPFAFVPWYFRVFTLPVVGPLVYGLTFANPIGRRLTEGALAGRRAEGTSLTEGFATVSSGHANNLGMLQAFCDAANRPPEEQATFAGPVDVLFGERTFSAVRASVQLILRHFSRARAYRVPGAGHLPIQEAPDLVADLVFGPIAGEPEDTALVRTAAPSGAR